jgi:hypothetical protein
MTAITGLAIARVRRSNETTRAFENRFDQLSIAPAERVRARRGIENNRNQLRVRRTFFERPIDFLHHGDVQDVKWQAGERDTGHAIVNGEFDVLIYGHLTKAGAERK